jgi:hypothetical protein
MQKLKMSVGSLVGRGDSSQLLLSWRYPFDAPTSVLKTDTIFMFLACASCCSFARRYCYLSFQRKTADVPTRRF